MRWQSLGAALVLSLLAAAPLRAQIVQGAVCLTMAN